MDSKNETNNTLWTHEENEYRIKAQAMAEVFQALVGALLEKGESVPYYKTAGKWLANNGHEILILIRKSL